MMGGPSGQKGLETTALYESLAKLKKCVCFQWYMALSAMQQSKRQDIHPLAGKELAITS